MAAFALVLATNPVLAFVICPNFSGAMGILLLLLSCAVCIGCTVFLFVRTGRVQGSDDIFLGESGALPTEVLAAVILFTPLLGMALGLSLGAVDVVIAGIGTAGGGVMLITHDIELALRVADRVAVFRDGTVVEETAVANFASPDLLQHPFSRELWHALPEHGFEAPGGSTEGGSHA